MTKEWRTLKLEILAETKQFLDDLKKSEKQTESFGEKMADFGKKAALAMAAFGAAAVAAGVQFAKAAAEDQQAANRLADTLRATTGATNAQIAAVEKYVLQTSLATGITDQQLRPSFERLARSTKDVETSQTLLNLALDLSAATSKPLEAVTSALAKAYDGNYTALNRLGLGIDQNLIKTKDFKGIYEELNSTFGEFSETRSEEAIVKFQRLQVAVQEAKEQIGAALLPIMEKLGDWLIKTGVPNLQAFIDGFTGQRGVTVAITAANEGAYNFGERLKDVFSTVYRLKEEFAALAVVIGSLWAAAKIASFITAIGTLVKAFQAWRTAAAAAAVATGAATGGISAGAALAGAAAVAGGLALLLSQYNMGGEGDFTGNGGVGLGNRPLGGQSQINAFQQNTGIDINSGLPLPQQTKPSGSTTTPTIQPVSSVSELYRRLTEIDTQIGNLTFQYTSGQISSSTAQASLDVLKAEMNQIENVVTNLQMGNVPGFIPPSTVTGGTTRGEYNDIIINVNSPSIIDENAFTRAVVEALNSVERRTAGGISALAGL